MTTYRYAQEVRGQRLHLVATTGAGQVARRALCGRHPPASGGWQVTFNVPLGNACQNCQRVLAAQARKEER